MQSLQSLGLQPIMSLDEFIIQVARPGVQPSPLGGSEAFAAQEPVPEEDEPIPSESFVDETDPASAHEEVASPEPVPQSSLAPVLDDPQPSAPASVVDQSIVQDPPSALVLDLNEHVEDHPQDD